MRFPVHDLDTSPPRSRPLLERVRDRHGSIPELVGILASSPPAALAHVLVGDALALASLAPAERHAVGLAVAVALLCAERAEVQAGAAARAGLDPGSLAAIAAGATLADARLEALRLLVGALLRRGGQVGSADLDPFFAAGLTPAHALDAAAVVAHETLSCHAWQLRRACADPA